MPPPPFFFSYAHNDALDEHLKHFFDEVSKRVRFMTGVKDDGFLDSRRLKAGEQWDDEIVDALCTCPVMVCLYSPSYFQSEVCARELQVFLDRRQLYIRNNPGRRPANIIPVLWQHERIPLTLPDFQYEMPRSPELTGEGVWAHADRGELRQFDAIAHSVAKRVKDARETPLPDPGYRPVLNGVPNAFKPHPLPPSEFDGPDTSAGPETATFVYASAPKGWRSLPFAPPDEKSLLYIAAAVAKGRDLQPYALTFDPAQANLLARVKDARGKNNLLVVIVDGGSLADPSLVARLREFDEERPDDCSTLVVWPRGTPAQDLVPQAFPKLSERQEPFFHKALIEPGPFAKAVGDSLDALQTSVLKNAHPMSALKPGGVYQSLPAVSASPQRPAN